MSEERGLSKSLGAVLKYETTLDLNFTSYTITWKIKNFPWLLENQTNRDINVVPELCDIPGQNSKNVPFQVKIKLLRRCNEVIEVYFKPRDTVLVATSILEMPNFMKFDKTLFWAIEDEWHLAAVLLKHCVGNSYYTDMHFNLCIRVCNNREYISRTIYGPQNKNDGEKIRDVIGDLIVAYKSQTFSDVVLRSVDGVEFPAHRALLASRSDVLRAHLNHDMAESRPRTIDTAFHADTLNNILCYIYTDTVCISEISNELLVAADYYLIEGLKELSADELTKKLTIENVIKTLELACLHSAPKLKNHALEFIHKNPRHKIVQTEGWKTLRTVELLKIIYEYDTNVEESEEEKKEHTDDKPRNLYTDLEKLFNEAQLFFSDVIIHSVDDQNFHAHKVILAQRSQVFKAHFEHNSENSIIESPFEAGILKNILIFMYTDQVNLDEMSVKLLEATDFYQLQGMKILCEEYLCKTLNIDNAIEVLEVAEKYRASYLMRHCLKYINESLGHDIIRTEGWKKLQSVDVAKRLYECKIDGCID